MGKMRKGGTNRSARATAIAWLAPATRGATPTWVAGANARSAPQPRANTGMSERGRLSEYLRDATRAASQTLHRLRPYDPDVEDLVQESVCLLLAQDPRPAFSTQRQLVAYLCTSAINIAKNRRRTFVRREAATSALTAVVQQFGWDARAEDTMDARQLLRAAQRGFPRRIYDVLTLAALGYTESEAAKHLRISVGTWKTRLRKARSLLEP
jgi:DNA-directed RNA polymerase specialized sigma24 family protein